MAEVIKMPRMSDTMTEGTIVSWLKKEGEKVKSGEVIAEVETDKATMELDNYFDGVLLHIGVQEGQSIAVDGIIAIIGKEGEDISGLLNGETKKETKNEAPIETKLVEQKASVISEVVSSPQINNSTTANQTIIENADTRIKASPLAKKMAEEKGIDLHSILGSGEMGRIIRKDIENVTPTTSAQIISSTPSYQNTSITQKGAYVDTPLNNMRKTIARRLSESMFSAPHFYLTAEIIMDKTMDFRKSLMSATGEKVSFNDIVIKAVALALKKHPKVNSSWMGDFIRTNFDINIGVAMAVEDGLIVPVIRNADQLGITDISKMVKEYSEKAKSKKLQPTDWEGNTFSISNLGMFGIDDFTAIINPPDACILAVGRIKESVIVKNGEMKAGNVMKVTLSCDHRVVDGAIGSAFLQTLRMFLEEPITMLS